MPAPKIGERTPGPWYWEAKVSPSSDGRKGTPHVRLMTAGVRGGYTVLTFDRMGMGGAQVKFLEGPLIEPYSKFVENVDHNGYGRLRHPDALLIAAAPELYAALEQVLASAAPHPEQHEAMTAAWTVARAAIAKARGEE